MLVLVNFLVVDLPFRVYHAAILLIQVNVRGEETLDVQVGAREELVGGQHGHLRALCNQLR